MTVISALLSLVNFVCFILVLLKLFPAKGVWWGLFGIICGLYTFIWGWQNANQMNIKNIMLVWTAAFVASIVINVALQAA